MARHGSGGCCLSRCSILHLSTFLSSAAMRWTNQKRQPVGVIMTQGVLYGIGSGFLFAPSISFIDEWFLLRRGIANGIL